MRKSSINVGFQLPRLTIGGYPAEMVISSTMVVWSMATALRWLQWAKHPSLKGRFFPKRAMVYHHFSPWRSTPHFFAENKKNV